MNQKIQELVYFDNKLSSSEPNKINESSKNIAIIIHVFYLDIWNEITHYLSELEMEYDLFITVPKDTAENEIINIFKSTPDVYIYMTENRGRDVLPFLQVMNIIGIENYKYICKLHTKKTGEHLLGDVWRKLLYFDLLGSNETVKGIVNLFENDENIGMVTGKNTILDAQKYICGNNEKINLLAEKSKIIYDENYLFPAGTMFWTRPEIIAPIIKLFANDQLDFEKEAGQKDHTLAHAIERFFGILCQAKERKIVKSPALYSRMEDQTLNETASLVLSQQYIGDDMFSMQKQIIQEKEQQVQEKEQQIQEKEQQIHYYHELAQSLRIKNRIKKFIPNRTIQVLKLIKTNPAVLKKVFYYLKRGEVRYIWTKVNEKSTNNLSEVTKLIEIKPKRYFKKFDVEDYSLGSNTIDIVIPVYNGLEYLEALFYSIEKNTSSSYRLIVINDCSPDKNVKLLLEKRLKNYPSAIFIDNEINLGFVKSVNKAVQYIQNNFVILNTDTEVPPYWLERLMYPIFSFNNVASTTPFTNAGTIASFPNFLEDNDIFENLSVNDLDKTFSKINPKDFYTELPTGVGFCMGVNYELVQKIGFFDEKAFGKGYCEENDWCQRAIENGYTNLLVPNLFVYHKHGGSFPSEERQKLISNNYMKLLKKHPNYDKDVHSYIKQDPHKTLRNILIILASSKKTGIHMIFDHALGGGANIYTNELIEKYRQDNKIILTIKYDFYSNHFKLYYKYKTYNFNILISSLTELKEFIEQLNIKELFLNNLVSFKNSYELLIYFSNLVKQKHIQLIVPIHDFYPICPSYTLLNDEGEYCDIPSLETCKTCMKKNNLEWTTYFADKVDMTQWRELWFKLLDQSASILCFSSSSKVILLKAYPKLLPNKIEIIPHEVERIDPVKLTSKKDSDKITIGILGAINYAKGLHVIKDLLKIIEKENLVIDIVIIGEISEHINSKYLHVTGRYKRDDLPNIIQHHHIDIFLIPSVWPETFSYTTQEIMMMEIPLMVFNLGAPSERVLNYEKGYIISDISTNSILGTIRKFQNDCSVK
ncbi:MAG: hypothetical protein COB07_12925 [Sulfurovum sp.]|nr:MAG: hypothetical protein COB07_12925 [Sulfurovum sp.]